MTVLVAIIAYFTLYDFPETANFLTEEERAFVVYRLKYQGASDTTINGVRVAQDDTFQWKFVKSAFLDWQIWTNIWVYWGRWTGHICMNKANKIRHRMPFVRYLTLPSHDHSRSWVHFIHSPASHGAYLHYRICTRDCGSVVE